MGSETAKPKCYERVEFKAHRKCKQGSHIVTCEGEHVPGATAMYQKVLDCAGREIGAQG
ncbi:MAG: hypothetical protein M3T56_11720 [Chloroflexota bacterium]|nr:hypothetical protein [Chloroflexota bacterium]